jgi:hypothetical protein
VLSDGKVISPVDAGEVQKISISKNQVDAGQIAGKIQKVINKDTLILRSKEDIFKNDYKFVITDKRTGKKTYQYTSAQGKTVISDNCERTETKYYTVAISGVDTSRLFKGEDFTANVMLAGALEDNGQRLRKFEVLTPVNEDQFRKYLDDGNILYRYAKKADGYAACEKCGGKGTLPNPKYKHGRLAAKFIDCPDCQGGKIKQYKIVKIPIKAPRRRKSQNEVAAR